MSSLSLSLFVFAHTLFMNKIYRLVDYINIILQFSNWYNLAKFVLLSLLLRLLLELYFMKSYIWTAQRTLIRVTHNSEQVLRNKYTLDSLSFLFIYLFFFFLNAETKQRSDKSLFLCQLFATLLALNKRLIAVWVDLNRLNSTNTDILLNFWCLFDRFILLLNKSISSFHCKTIVDLNFKICFKTNFILTIFD